MARPRPHVSVPALVLCVAVLAIAAPALAARDSGTIAFQGVREDGSGIYTMSADGGNLDKLAAGKQPSISRDGKTIVFVKGGDIYRIDADGGNLTQVTDDGMVDAEPALSPDGKTVVFSGEPQAKGGLPPFSRIFVVDIDGSDQQELTHGQAIDTEPSFSPDGRRIVFARGPGEVKLVTMTADGEGVTYLSGPKDPFGVPQSPSYSPNGKRILFNATGQDSNGAVHSIYSFDADDGSNLDVITKAGNEGFEPAYSPDGSSIVYRRDNDNDLFTMDADGGNVERLTNTSEKDGSNSDPSWGG